MSDLQLERCCLCDDPTERAGRADDSIYLEVLEDYEGYKRGDEIGPLCVECLGELEDLGVIRDE